MRTLFRLDGGTGEQETAERKLEKLREYKALLRKEGKKIVSEKQEKHKRFGNVIILEIENE